MGDKLIRTSQYASTRDKSRLISLTTFCDENKEKTVDVSYLDFHMAFDTISHNIFFGKLRNYGLDGYIARGCCKLTGTIGLIRKQS